MESNTKHRENATAAGIVCLSLYVMPITTIAIGLGYLGIQKIRNDFAELFSQYK